TLVSSERRDVRMHSGFLQYEALFRSLHFTLCRSNVCALAESHLDSALSQAELRFRQAMIRLAENLEDDSVTQREVAIELNLPLFDPAVDALIEMGLRERADVRAAEREVEASKERLVLEEAGVHPDITSFAGY